MQLKALFDKFGYKFNGISLRFKVKIVWSVRIVEMAMKVQGSRIEAQSDWPSADEALLQRPEAPPPTAADTDDQSNQ